MPEEAQEQTLIHLSKALLLCMHFCGGVAIPTHATGVIVTLAAAAQEVRGRIYSPDGTSGVDDASGKLR